MRTPSQKEVGWKIAAKSFRFFAIINSNFRARCQQKFGNIGGDINFRSMQRGFSYSLEVAEELTKAIISNNVSVMSDVPV